MKTKCAYFSDSSRYLLQGTLAHTVVMSELSIQRRWYAVLFGTALLISSLVLQGFCIQESVAQEEELEMQEEEPAVANQKNTNGFFPAENPWFNEGDAKTVFSADPVSTDSANVGFYKEREEKKELEEEIFQQPQIQQAGAQQQPSRPPFDTRKAKPSQLVAFFGNPNEDAPLTPEDNAPKPFKAMMAAMDSGNDELAYKYARQYVRYLRNLESRVATVSQFAEIAIEREGIRQGYIKDNPYKHLLNKDLEDEDQKPMSVKDALRSVDPRTAKILRQAEADETEAAINFEEHDNAIPVDPKGEVDVLLFFKIGEAASAQMAQAIQQIKSKLSDDSSTNITGFVLNRVSADARDQFMSENGINFEVQNGQAAVGALGIRISPTVVFVARNAGKSYRVEELKSPAEMFAIIMQMKRGQNG